MVAYNHEKYIAQAIESVLCQATTFKVELVIADDCSTDSTPCIVKRYVEANPSRIVYIRNKYNLGTTLNFANALRNCRGLYVAILDGDDYWSSSIKLSTQVQFLLHNPTYVGCYCATSLIDKYQRHLFFIPRKIHSFPSCNIVDLLIHDSFMATSSILFRNKDFTYLPDVFFTWKFGCDWPLNLLNTVHGPMGYINIPMSVYRSASSSHSWSAQKASRIWEEAIKYNLAFNSYFNFIYDDIIQKKIFQYKLNYARSLALEGSIGTSIYLFIRHVLEYGNITSTLSSFVLTIPLTIFSRLKSLSKSISASLFNYAIH